MGWFQRFAQKTSAMVGSPVAFVSAVAIVVAWAFTGPIFGFSDTWQLVINTGTTIVTFLVVFLIQNTQNRDVKAIHLKLDELIRGVKGARTSLVDLEAMSDEELDELQREFQRIREMHSQHHPELKDNVLEEEKKNGARRKQAAGETEAEAGEAAGDREEDEAAPKAGSAAPARSGKAGGKGRPNHGRR